MPIASLTRPKTDYVSDYAGFDGNASNGRWLSREFSNPSNQSPYVVTIDRALRRLSLTSNGNSTVTVSIIANPRGTPSTITTISLSGASKVYVDNLNILISAGTEIGYRVTAGSCSRPSLAAEYEAA